MSNKIILTKEGFNKLKKELKELESKIIPEILKRLKKARADGDLRENNQWIKAKEDLDLAHKRREEIKFVLNHASIQKGSSATNSDVIKLGDSVLINMDNKEMTFTIVSQLEVDPFNNKISEESPLGKLLINAKVGDTIKYQTPNGEIKVIKIIKKLKT